MLIEFVLFVVFITEKWTSHSKGNHVRLSSTAGESLKLRQKCFQNLSLNSIEMFVLCILLILWPTRGYHHVCGLTASVEDNKSKVYVHTRHERRIDMLSIAWFCQQSKRMINHVSIHRRREWQAWSRQQSLNPYSVVSLLHSCDGKEDKEILVTVIIILYIVMMYSFKELDAGNIEEVKWETILHGEGRPVE